MDKLDYTSGAKVADAIYGAINKVANDVYKNIPNDRTVYGIVAAKKITTDTTQSSTIKYVSYTVRIRNQEYTNVNAFRSIGELDIGDRVICLIPNNNMSDLIIRDVANGTSKSVSGEGPAGPEGPPGQNATITDASATVDNTSGTPQVEVTLGGTEFARTFNFDFTGLKGATGTTGNAGVNFLYCTSASATEIGLGVLMPTSVPAKIGDLVLFSNGDLREITEKRMATFFQNGWILSDVLTNLKGGSGAVTTVVGQTGDVTAQQLISAILTGEIGFGENIIAKSIFNSNEDGYVLYNSGLLIQWGVATKAATPDTVTFAQSYGSGVPFVLPISLTGTTDYNVYSGGIMTRTSTNFTYNLFNNALTNVLWIAIGLKI